MFPITHSVGALTIGTVTNDITGETRSLYRHSGPCAPVCLDFEKTVCAYWENVLDLFNFACDVLHWDRENVTWTDTSTFECFSYWDLADTILEEELLEEVASC